MSGTEWAAPGQGSTVKQLYVAFVRLDPPIFCWRFLLCFVAPTSGEDKTNLHLTGAPITAEDWARLESEQFKVGE